MIIVIIISFKGAIQDFWQFPLFAVNCLQHVRIQRVSCYVPCGMKGYVRYDYVQRCEDTVSVELRCIN